MTIIARFPVELNGHVYRKGEKCSYEGDVTQRIADNFTDANGNPIDLGEPAAAPQASVSRGATASSVAAIIEKTVAVMGREGIKQALDGMNVTFPPSANTSYLAKQLLIARGEIEA